MLPDRPETRYAETEDGFVAYQVFGEGGHRHVRSPQVVGQQPPLHPHHKHEIKLEPFGFVNCQRNCFSLKVTGLDRLVL